jgi:hypothetical protein
LVLLGLVVEDSEDFLERIVGAINCFGESAGRPVVPGGEIGRHQFFLATEEVVQGGFGDSGALDDAVGTDGLDAFGVEEFVGSIEEALSCRGSMFRRCWCGRAHGSGSFQTDLSIVRLVRRGRW